MEGSSLIHQAEGTADVHDNVSEPVAGTAIRIPAGDVRQNIIRTAANPGFSAAIEAKAARDAMTTTAPVFDVSTNVIRSVVPGVTGGL